MRMEYCADLAATARGKVVNFAEHRTRNGTEDSSRHHGGVESVISARQQFAAGRARRRGYKWQAISIN